MLAFPMVGLLSSIAASQGRPGRTLLGTASSLPGGLIRRLWRPAGFLPCRVAHGLGDGGRGLGRLRHLGRQLDPLLASNSKWASGAGVTW